jgi:hypothetical protein
MSTRPSAGKVPDPARTTRLSLARYQCAMIQRPLDRPSHVAHPAGGSSSSCHGLSTTTRSDMARSKAPALVDLVDVRNQLEPPNPFGLNRVAGIRIDQGDPDGLATLGAVRHRQRYAVRAACHRASQRPTSGLTKRPRRRSSRTQSWTCIGRHRVGSTASQLPGLRDEGNECGQQVAALGKAQFRQTTMDDRT